MLTKGRARLTRLPRLRLSIPYSLFAANKMGVVCECGGNWECVRAEHAGNGRATMTDIRRVVPYQVERANKAKKIGLKLQDRPPQSAACEMPVGDGRWGGGGEDVASFPIPFFGIG